MPKKLTKPAAQKPPGGTSPRAPKMREGRIPLGVNDAEIEVEGGTAKLTNLNKIFWPKLGLTKRDLLQYYLDVSPYLMPHVKDRAMVMKRYPNGIAGGFFFMNVRRRPAFVRSSLLDRASLRKRDRLPGGSACCFASVGRESGLHRSESLVCALRRRDRPDYLHFDLDPVSKAPDFERVLKPRWSFATP